MTRKLRLGLTFLGAATLALGLTACEENLAYFNKFPQEVQKKLDEEVTIKALVETSTVDILWVIDNSGSMDDYQQAVIKNTADFMDLFAQKKLDWKMGLISTDPSDDPYIGFKAGDELTSNTPLGVDKFKIAVSDLGTSGTGTEETLNPLVDTLRTYPTFLRNNAALALIFITDAEEQSDRRDWLKEFRTVAPGVSNVYGYGVFASVESGCQSAEGSWRFTNSPYETFFKGLTEYKTFKICEDFGVNLNIIGQDLIQKTAYYWVSIPFRPIASTIRVEYKGAPLKAGPQEEGGLWYYDYQRNAIMLYSVDFAGGENDSIHVFAEEDIGFER